MRQRQRRGLAPEGDGRDRRRNFGLSIEPVSDKEMRRRCEMLAPGSRKSFPPALPGNDDDRGLADAGTTMKTLEIALKTMSFGKTYEVRAPGADALVMTVSKGALLDGDGREVARLAENFWNTRADIRGPDDAALASLAFPFPLFGGKRLTLSIGDRAWPARYAVEDRTSVGGISGGTFACKDADGAVQLAVTKELALAHRFVVQLGPAVPEAVGLLAAVAIDHRFFNLR